MEPQSATTTPESAPNQMGRAPAALVSLKLTESQAEKIGLGDQWRAARNRTLLRQKRKMDGAQRLESTVQELVEFAAVLEISERKLIKTLGISKGSWLRCRKKEVDPRSWLPKLESALARLKAS